MKKKAKLEIEIEYDPELGLTPEQFQTLGIDFELGELDYNTLIMIFLAMFETTGLNNETNRQKQYRKGVMLSRAMTTALANVLANLIDGGYLPEVNNPTVMELFMKTYRQLNDLASRGLSKRLNINKEDVERIDKECATSIDELKSKKNDKGGTRPTDEDFL